MSEQNPPQQPPMVLHPQVEDRDALAERLLATHRVWDPWSLEHKMRFHGGPLIFSGAFKRRLDDAARRVGALYESLARIVWGRPAFLDDFYHLTPWQKRMWLASGGRWHAFARLDCFLCRDGRLQICEINADTPSGHDDAFTIGQVVGEDHPHLVDPNARYVPSLLAVAEQAHAAMTGADGGLRAVGIVYPTDQPEDITLIHMISDWFAARGVRVVHGSPFNIVPGPSGRGVSLFGQPVDLIYRHYKTDWWGERAPVWRDEPPFYDEEALEGPLRDVLRAELEGHLAVLNPFGSIVPQNKRSQAFFWRERRLFSASDQATIREFIPETWPLESMDAAKLLGERELWVLKSDFGCEGDEVVIGRHVDDELWGRALQNAVPGRWVAQRFFDVMPLNERWLPNIGVYLVGGAPVGLFTRLSPLETITDDRSRVAPSFVEGR